METNLKFNSAVCTSREQSERLLALGLKKETADCRICPLVTDPNQFLIMDMGIQPLDEDEDEMPAWSLHRLIQIANLSQDWKCISGNWYDEVIASIQSKIHIGELNKEYLEE